MDTSPYRGHGTISTPCIHLALCDQSRRKWECRSPAHLVMCSGFQDRGVVTEDRRSAFGQATLFVLRVTTGVKVKGEAIDVQVIVN
ncbi:hypothetical protein BT69DRAFT_1279976, partial [Atractiella rhizophila]